VDQLGSSSSDVRVGGVYSLERLMSDSGKDHETIVEVLSAFVRRKSPASGQRKVHEDWTRGTIPDGLEPLATEVQAALTVLARRPDRAELRPIDLRRCDLRLAFLHGAKFRRAILNDSWLDYADLGEIDLREASLRQTGLAHTWMRAARLDGANVRDADFRWAYLREASLENTAMEKAKVDYADLDRPTFAR
jgi:Pentapeptide repeats (8 copies)